MLSLQLINEEYCSKNRYQVQEKVITSTSICGCDYLRLPLIPASSIDYSICLIRRRKDVCFNVENFIVFPICHIWLLGLGKLSRSLSLLIIHSFDVVYVITHHIMSSDIVKFIQYHFHIQWKIYAYETCYYIFANQLSRHATIFLQISWAGMH